MLLFSTQSRTLRHPMAAWTIFLLVIGSGCSDPAEQGTDSVSDVLCTPGDTGCETNNVVVCDEENVWTVTQYCAFGETCALNADSNSHECQSGAQSPGDETIEYPTNWDKDSESLESVTDTENFEDESDTSQPTEEDTVAQDETSNDTQAPSDAENVEETAQTDVVNTSDTDDSDILIDTVDDSAEEDSAVIEESDADSSDDHQDVADFEILGENDAEEKGACEDEKLGDQFDETALQGKMLTAGLACQEQDEFGSSAHTDCLREQFMETGIGPNCANCFANFVVCFFKECSIACEDVDNNPEPCVTCMEATICDDELNECSGLNW